MGVLLFVASVFLIWARSISSLPSDSGDQDYKSILKRVVGGEGISVGQWPWLVYLQAKVPDRTILGIPISYKYRHCGGSLISDRWVLTAAHCFDFGDEWRDPKHWHALMGDIARDHNLLDNVKSVLGEMFGKGDWIHYNIHAEKLIIHGDYDQSKIWLNDIALIKLSQPVPAGAEVARVQSVQLAEQADATFPPDNTDCVMKGWGCTEVGGPVVNLASQVVLPKISDETCRNLYRVDTTTRLCAGYNMQSKGICQGDSGGPLVCRKGNKWIQVGIASFGRADNPGNHPAAFTRVSNYALWIKMTMSWN